MAKQTTQNVFDEEDKVTDTELSDALDQRFVTYAFMSLEDRALPDARDGLKPSQRRVLVAMNDLKLTARGSTEKSAKICGDTSGNYHPHGEAVVYPTMYRLAQSWVMRDPLLIGQGNFGNLDGDPPAAMRYTEAKMSLVGEAMLEDLSPEVVRFVPNYNEKRQEPTILPGKFPNLLVNGAQGIAVGWATTLPPHNLREVVAVIRAYIKNPELTTAEVIQLMPGPDFPTGGRVLGQDGILEYYNTGRGSVLMEGKWDITKSPRGVETITITELPYQSSPEGLSLEIEALVKKGTLTGISDLKNLSSKKTGIKVVIDVARGNNSGLVVNNLLKNTSLRKSFSVNQTVLIGGKVVPDAGVLKLVKEFVDHRKAVLTSKYKAELDRQQARIHILEGMIRVSQNIKAVVDIILASESPEAATAALMKAKFVDTEIQAKAVLEIKLSQLTKLEANKIADEKRQREERVAWLRKVLADEKEILALVSREQDELAKKMGTDRRTEIVRTVRDVSNEDLVKDERLIVSLTIDGYVKSLPVDSYRVQGRGGKGVIGGKGDDNVSDVFEAGSKELVLFFTNKGLMYKKKAYEIPQGNRTSKGVHVSNLLNLSEGEQVTNMISLKSLDQPGFLVIATKQGLIKRSEIADYNTSLKSAGLTAIKLGDGDQVAFVMVTDGKRDIFIVTAWGNAVRYNEEVVSVQGRATQGCRALKLDDDDTIAQIFSLDPAENPKILVVTKAGFAKQTDASEFKAFTNRNVKGYAVIKKAALDKNGEIVGACAISANESFLVLTTQGKVVRIKAEDVRETGRTTTGVRAVRLNDGDSVVRIAKLNGSNGNGDGHDDEDDAAEGDAE
jgi:DNA gyrase subunit A